MNRPRSLSFIFLAVLICSSFLMADTDPRDSSSPYGALAFVAWNHDWNSHYEAGDALERDAALAQAAGIVWIRMDFLWSDLEPEKGRFDFTRYDHIVDVLGQHGIRILGLLEYNPLWREGHWNQAPIVDDYNRYAQATVHHFKDRVKYWEVWNEPDQDTYWMPQDDLTAYSALLKSVYPIIKVEDPTSKVLLGGLAKDYPFHLRTIYKKAGAASFDIVNIHPFVSPLYPNSLQQVKGIYIAVEKVMAEFHEEQKPIWVTEMGCPGVVTPTRSNAWWQGLSPTEAQQADWLTAIYTHMLQWPGVAKVFWAFFRETPGHFHNGVDNFGLVRVDFSKKPAYDAYKAIANPNAPPTAPEVDSSSKSPSE